MAMRGWFPKTLMLLTLPACGRLFESVATAQDDVRVTVVAGTVQDTEGAPLGAVVVEMMGGVALPTITLDNGFYVIVGLNVPDDDVILRFSKDGFMRVLKRQPNTTQSAVVFQQDVVMKRTGDIQRINVDAENTVAQDKTRVTIEPGDLVDGDSNPLTGGADVRVTPIDPSGPEIELFPGFAAAMGEERVLLESFAAVDIEIMSGDRFADIAPGQTLTVEFPIPDAQQDQFTLGETLEDFLWSLNETTGVWEEGLSVTVGQSTSNPAKKAFFGEVPHLSTWNCDRPLRTTCLRGRVVDLASGSGIGGAVVTGKGVDYNGRSRTVTDADGEYCIPVKRDATVKLIANAFGFASEPLVVESPNVVSTCLTGNCLDVADLIIDPIGRTSCISGTVYSEFGLPPFPFAVVFTDAFTWTQTDASGQFCLPAEPNTEVRMVIIDPSTFLTTGEATETQLTVAVPAGTARCGVVDGGCVAVTVGEPLPPIAFEQCGQCGGGMGIAASGVLAAFFMMRARRGTRTGPRPKKVSPRIRESAE